MSCWVVMETICIDSVDGIYNENFKGCFSSKEKAEEAIKEYGSNLDYYDYDIFEYPFDNWV